MRALLVWCAVLLVPRAAQAGGDVSREAGAETAWQPTLVISGEVVRKEELWDRRPNPLMGRPDCLKEIVLQVRIARVLRGVPPADASRIAISIKGQRQLIGWRYLAVGWRGTFSLTGDGRLYDLVDFGDGVAPAANPRAQIVPKPLPAGNPPPFPDNVGARSIRESKRLREKAVREIARRYGMADARVVYMVSHQGPRPPRGGYVYWGVKGRIGGMWHIWQAGGYGAPRAGTELIDPKRYQK